MTSDDRTLPWQIASTALPERTWDVAVIGAGPAGTMAAIGLQSKGHDVLLLDRSRFPRDKVCGDGLIADALGCLERVSLLEEVLEHSHVSHAVEIHSPARISFRVAGRFVTLKRRVLDTLLAKKAYDHGATFACGTVSEVSTEGDRLAHCRLREHAQPIRARVVVIATGADISLARCSGWAVPPRPSAVAARRYVRSSYPIDVLTASCEQAGVPGYGWIFPLGGGEYNVGFGSNSRAFSTKRLNLREAFEGFITGFPPAVEMMKQGEVTSPLKGGRLRCGLDGVRPYVQGNVLVIGETIGTTLSFTGEGIGKAMETGEMAAEVIHEGLACDDLVKMRVFRERIESELLPRYRSYKYAEMWLSRGWINNAAARRMRKSDYLRRLLSEVVSEEADVRDVFSVRTLVRSLWA